MYLIKCRVAFRCKSSLLPIVINLGAGSDTDSFATVLNRTGDDWLKSGQAVGKRSIAESIARKQPTEVRLFSM